MAKRHGFDSAGYRDYTRHFLKDVLPKIEQSSYFLAIAPGGPAEADVKMATEIGMCILLDKPLIVLAPKGRPVAERLLRIADHVIVGDIETREGMDAMHLELERILRQ